jgi:hypothetical protein
MRRLWFQTRLGAKVSKTTLEKSGTQWHVPVNPVMVGSVSSTIYHQGPGCPGLKA